VHVILVSGRGEGFCAGSTVRTRRMARLGVRGRAPIAAPCWTQKDQAINHFGDHLGPDDDYQMMSRSCAGFSS